MLVTNEMEHVIPEAVEKCTNDTLRMAAIAAIHRGSEVDMNMALHDCIQFNKNQQREIHKQKVLQEQASWTEWFTTQFNFSSH